MFVARMPAVLLLTTAALANSACEQVKSASPLSPSIAGPIAGVTITQPSPIQPVGDSSVKDSEQPITLAIRNPESNSVRPYTISIQLGADPTFSSTSITQVGLQPGPDGVTRLLIPGKLPAGRTYYWRTKAEDGANESEWSTPSSFHLLQPIIIGTPTPLSPTGGTRANSHNPMLLVRNGNSSGPYKFLDYNFQVSQNTSFTAIIANDWVREGGDGQTGYTVPASPGTDQVLYWRVRANDDQGTLGGWSVTESYRTPLPITVAPPPSTGGGGTGSGASCASNSGPAIVSCIAQRFPSYLAGGISLHQREENMKFLRDRIIEAGICGGLDLAWNLKRGVGPHSIDALAWRTGGRVEVVDIGVAYDDASRPLALNWGIVAGPPGYDTYQPRPSCQ
jgi:hypothetical protein